MEMDFKRIPGHWVLAALGKTVLRPGGLELTRSMMKGLNIGEQDEVIEFAPGLGITAQMTLARNPRSYVAIEQNEAAAATVRTYAHGANRQVLLADAQKVPLPDASATVLYGEAMLTMQTLAQKETIVAEARRLLKPGGRYGIHEMNLKPDSIDPAVKKQIEKDLSQAIRVNASPFTLKEWQELLIRNGFRIVTQHTAPMHLLHWRRMVQDEGWKGVCKIVGNVLRNPQARQRVLGMRQQFVKHADYLGAVCLVAERLPDGPSDQ